MISLIQDIAVSVADTFSRITSPFTQEKLWMNQIPTLWTLKWWASEPKNDNQINLLGDCEQFLEFSKRFPWFWLYIPQRPKYFSKEPHLSLIFLMNQISTLLTMKIWASERNNDDKIKLLGSSEWFVNFCKWFSWFRP